MELVLVGQPYSGKSTIFNEVVGYRSVSTNAPGAPGEHTHGELQLDGERVTVVDLPGLYSLQVSDDAGDPTVEHILDAPPDTVLVNVIDASVLSRSLELTLQLMELRRPMVVALNMMDEARRKGIEIDAAALSQLLGVPVVVTVGKKGEGVFDLFHAARRVGHAGAVPAVIPGPAHVERLVKKLEELLRARALPSRLAPRFLAIKIIERDPCVSRTIDPHLGPDEAQAVQAHLAELEAATEQRSEYVMSAVRHNMAFDLFETVARVGARRPRGVRHRLDDLLMHPVLGYVFLVAILAGTFTLVFKIGNAVEPIFLSGVGRLSGWLAARLGEGTLSFAIANGVVTGLGGGVGIVIPYLLPFFVALAFLEDTGYLPRIAYLIDNVMHRIGLHGLSVVPLVMGYGCSVPAVMATRILRSRRDRLITATLATLIPCSARMTIIFGLVGFFLSMKAAVLVYLVNAILIGVVGKLLSTAMPEESPGLILEIPRYQVPEVGKLAWKVWYRLREFIVIAWPLLIAGSVVLEVIDHFALAAPLNDALSPFTSGVLGLPVVVGTTLLFGILRKELALVLLFAALGTSDVPSMMSGGDILRYAFFVTFYLPCLATFAALAREFGARTAAIISLSTLGIVSGLTAALRLVAPLLA